MKQTSKIELIRIYPINKILHDPEKNDMKYCFGIDMNTKRM